MMNIQKKDLNEFGIMGWELICMEWREITYSDRKIIYTFKQQVNA